MAVRTSSFPVFVALELSLEISDLMLQTFYFLFMFFLALAFTLVSLPDRSVFQKRELFKRSSMSLFSMLVMYLFLKGELLHSRDRQSFIGFLVAAGTGLSAVRRSLGLMAAVFGSHWM